MVQKPHFLNEKGVEAEEGQLSEVFEDWAWAIVYSPLPFVPLMITSSLLKSYFWFLRDFFIFSRRINGLGIF